MPMLGSRTLGPATRWCSRRANTATPCASAIEPRSRAPDRAARRARRARDHGAQRRGLPHRSQLESQSRPGRRQVSGPLAMDHGRAADPGALSARQDSTACILRSHGRPISRLRTARTSKSISAISLMPRSRSARSERARNASPSAIAAGCRTRSPIGSGQRFPGTASTARRRTIRGSTSSTTGACSMAISSAATASEAG